VAVVFVSIGVSFQAVPNCLPNFPVEHEVVNLAVNLVAPVVAPIPTQVQAFFVSALAAVVAVEVHSPTSGGVVQAAPHASLKLVRVQVRDDMAEMSEDDAW
jgi:hypothetical protein